MKNLQLSLKKKWFDMTKEGIKTEDYREVNSYWMSRLCLHMGEHKSKKWWDNYIENHYPIYEDNYISFRAFDKNIMTLGYPKSTDTERIIKFQHKGIEFGYGKKEWGSEYGKLYFVIKHGQIIKHK